MNVLQRDFTYIMKYTKNRNPNDEMNVKLTNVITLFTINMFFAILTQG